MKTNSSSENAFPVAGQSKDKQLEVSRLIQRRKVYRALLSGSTFTMMQLSVATGIERATICRRLSELCRMRKVARVSFGICPITKYPKVGFYSADEKMFPGYSNIRDL